LQKGSSSNSLDTTDLYQAIDELGIVSFDGLVYRHVAPGIDCRSGEGAQQQGGRWNPPNSFPAIYTGLTRQSTVAEFYRLAERNHIEPAALLPRTLCIMRAELHGVLDLRVADALKAVGLDGEIVLGDDVRPCRRVGEAAHKLGLQGLLAPSATGTGEVLVIYMVNLRADSSLEPSGTETWETLADLP